MTRSDHQSDSSAEPSLKLKTARALKWNSIDKISSQVLYAIVGVILANVLPKEDFGLVGALLIFQAFATLFVDSGFGAALLQKKEPSQDDYSTIFWMNIIFSIVIYALLWIFAPVIASIFHDPRLIPLGNGMFLTFIFNALGIVQINRLMKRMDVRMIAIANIIGLIVSGGLGVYLAIAGYGAWALVWQSVSLAAVKSGWVWITGGWIPSFVISRESFRQMWRIGLSVFSSSFLNTVCLNAYNFVIGAFFQPLTALGIYTQADKWSKMGSASVSQIMTASFIPLLSRAQGESSQFHRYQRKTNRFAAFITLPFLAGLAVIGTPLFHTLFSDKWDAAIPLFQILSIRGIFIVLLSLYNNYLLALGKGKLLVKVEIIKDVILAAAILATVFFHDITLLVQGQLLASILTWLVVLFITSRSTGLDVKAMLSDMIPFAVATLVMMALCIGIMQLIHGALLCLSTQILAGVLIYILTLKLMRNEELTEATGYILGRFRRNE